MSDHNKLGKIGEFEAQKLLKIKGYEILQTNWRSSRYEIDIIAENSTFIVFVEVKSRRTNYFGDPESFVSKAQKKRIIEAADHFLLETDSAKEARFDIISIIDKKGVYSIDHIEGAFSVIG